MAQIIQNSDCRSIRFETIDLPQSMMGISILIAIDDFSESTGDWIWRLPHCNGLEKSGGAQWCRDSAAEIIDYMIENRGTVTDMIRERLGPQGFGAEETFIEWIEGLTKICEIASKTDGDCRWIAEIPGFDPKPGLERAMRYLDSLDSKTP